MGELAWTVHYRLFVIDPSGTIQGYDFVDTCKAEGFEIYRDPDGEPLMPGIVGIESTEPLKRDAIRDSLRRAYDVCSVLSVARGRALRPLVPPLRADPGPAATSDPGGLSDAFTVEYMDHLSDCAEIASAVQLLSGDEVLQADADTFRMAMEQADAPTRVINQWRIYEHQAAELLDAEPPLLDETQISAATSAVDAVLAKLDAADRKRAGEAVRNALGRMRTRSRWVVLSEKLSRLSDQPVLPADVKRLDLIRNRYAHRPTHVGERPAHEDSTLLQEVVRANLRSRMFLNAQATGDAG